MKNFLFLISHLLLFSCASPVQSNQGSPEIVKYPFSSTVSSLNEFIREIEVIPLKVKDDCIFGPFLHTLQRDSSFYIGDMTNTKKIYRFNRDGHLLNTIGAPGKGPGEHLGLSDFYVDDQTNDVYLSSYPDLRLYHFSKEGHFKGMKTQKYSSQSFIKKDAAFWVYGGNNNGYMPERIVRLDTNLNLLHKYYPLETKTIHISLGPVFSQWKDQVYVVMGFDPQIYQIHRDSLLPILQFDFGNCHVPDSYWQADDPMQAFAELQQKGFCNINNFMVNDHYLISEQNEQSGSNRLQVWYVCAIKQLDSGKWFWIRKKVPENGMMIDNQKPSPSSSQPEWYMGKIQGFAKDGRLMILADGLTLDYMQAKDKALIRNPETLEQIDPESDSFLFLCTLK